MIVDRKGREVCLKQYFKDTSNFLSFAVALVPSILFYIFLPHRPVPYSVFVIILLILLLLGWLSIKLYLDLKELQKINAKAITLEIPIIDCQANRCLCRPNNLITFESIVSFYERIGESEKFLCLGTVETITSKGLAQIELCTLNEQSKEELLTYIHEHKDKILVRPTITTKTIDLAYKLLIKEERS